MTNSSDIFAAVLPVAEALEVLGVAYHIGGSVASSVQGIARSTIDVDLVADLRPTHVRPLVKQLQANYYIDAGMIHDAIRERSSFNVIHLESIIKVDIFSLKARPFDQEMASRIEQKPLAAPAATPPQPQAPRPAAGPAAHRSATHDPYALAVHMLLTACTSGP